ncbi:hypothetical protein JCM16408A_50600 [Methylobacterium phyllosphaerae]
MPRGSAPDQGRGRPRLHRDFTNMSERAGGLRDPLLLVRQPKREAGRGSSRGPTVPGQGGRSVPIGRVVQAWRFWQIVPERGVSGAARPVGARAQIGTVHRDRNP